MSRPLLLPPAVISRSLILQCFAGDQEVMVSFDDVQVVVPALLLLRRLSKAASKHLLGRVGDVEEAVCVPVAGINVSHAGGHARHALLRHQEEETFGGVQINLVPDRKRCRRRWSETPPKSAITDG